MTSRSARRARWSAGVLLAMVALEALGLLYLKQLPFSRITVLNYDRVEDLYWKPTPGRRSVFVDSRGVKQVIVGPEYSVFRQYRKAVEAECGTELDAARNDLERAVILRRWVRAQYEFDAGSGKNRMFDYADLLARRSQAGLCDAFATFYVGAAISVGLPARLVHLNTTAGIDSRGHYVTEVFLPDEGRWVVMDPLYNAHYTAGGRALSALEIHRLALRDRALRTVKVVRGGPAQPPVALALDNYYRHFQVVSRTDFDSYRLNLFGRRLLFLNWVGDGAGPMGRREAVLRVVLFFVWPLLGLGAAGVAIAFGRPRTSLFLLVGKKPVRPEYRE